MTKLQFFFDYLSPYAYLAQTQITLLGEKIEYRPFDIRVLMPLVENVPTSVICKPKNRYVQADLKRWVQHYGVPFQRNPQILELDSRRLLRATLWAEAQGPVDPIVSALFSAMWGIPQPLLTAADIGNALRAAGLDLPGIETEIDDPHWDAELTAATDRAAQAGVFGAPFMVLGDETFFGNDRMDFVRAALARSV